MALARLPSSAGGGRGELAELGVPVVRLDGACSVVFLAGEADVSTRPALCEVLCRVIALRCGDVVIDLSRSTFIDSAIVRALAAAHELLDGEGRRLTFRSPSMPAVRVLDVFGLTGLIETPQQATP
jgi:anti-anti-sigma factor